MAYSFLQLLICRPWVHPGCMNDMTSVIVGYNRGMTTARSRLAVLLLLGVEDDVSDGAFMQILSLGNPVETLALSSLPY